MKLAEPIDLPSDLGTHRSYALGDRYRVVLSHIAYGAGTMPDRWYAVLVQPRERILGDFGSQTKAVRACRDHADSHSRLF